jgi:hypothetical protein
MLNGADPGAIDMHGDVPLFLAIRASNITAVTKLLNYDFDLSVRNNKGLTALHIACQGGSLPIVHLLLEARADVTAVDLAENTPLHFAVLNGWKEIVRRLLRAGANPTARNIAGKSPVSYASPETAQIIRIHLEGTDVVHQSWSPPAQETRKWKTVEENDEDQRSGISEEDQEEPPDEIDRFKKDIRGELASINGRINEIMEMMIDLRKHVTVSRR